MAFLLYLNTKNWKETDKGGFIIFDNSDAKHLSWPEYTRLSNKDEKKLRVHNYFEYKENRLIGFCNSPNSWHQAPPTRLSNDLYRDCFQVNLFVCKNKSKSLEIVYSLAILIRNFLKKLLGIRFNIYT